MTPEERQILSDRFRLRAMTLTGDSREEFIEILRRGFAPSASNRILSRRAVELWIAPPSFSQKRNFIPRNAAENDDFEARVFFATLFILPISIPGGESLVASGSTIEVRARRFRSIVYPSEAYQPLRDNLTGADVTTSHGKDDGEPRVVFLSMNLSGVDTTPEDIEGEYDDPLED